MSEYEKKLNEAFLNPELNSQLSCSSAYFAFKAGSDFGREYQRGVEDEAVKILVDALKAIAAMKYNSEIGWGGHAKKALRAYNKSKDGVKP